MDRGLRERVRWGNVGRALGLVALVALVVAWPALSPEAPVLPGREVVPVVPGPRVTPGPRVVRPRRVRPRSVAPAAPRQRVRRAVRRVRRAGEGGGGAVPVRRAPVAGRGAVPVRRAPAATAAPPAPAVQGSPAPADPDPVLREFGPEGP